MAKGKLPTALRKYKKTSAQMARMGKGGSKVKPRRIARSK